jgi:hypothetical protein
MSKGIVMIPKNIRREHILKAIDEVRKTGVPKGRGSRKFLIEFDGDYYPPKYIISLANRYANGKELKPSEFSGGIESNNFLRVLGFKIVEALPKKAVLAPLKKRHEGIVSPTLKHDERCPKCKETIRKILEKIYGKVEQNYKFEVGTRPENFLNIQGYSKLKEIYKALQSHRGFEEFVKAKTLPNCDFFVPSPGFIVEFDESQHFTLPRRIALEKYPNELELGFNRGRWIKLCEEINARDDAPPYRDEQRAWYDTLRDFLPTIKGLKPTIRLFARDFVWCSLNPNDTSDVAIFKKFMRKASESWKIEVREEPNPVFSRIIIASEWNGDPDEARALLKDICMKWPNGRKVKFLVTCGGFVQFVWPKSITRMIVGDNKNPNEDAVKALVTEAKNHAMFVFSDEIVGKLRQFTDYVTLGIDSSKEKISTTQNYIGQLHVELVFLIDLRTYNFYWTGKSYPTSSQQNGLVRISDLESHFLDLKDVGNVMILGCHDLTIFNDRNWKKTGEFRRTIKLDFRKLAKDKKPKIVLHHPHTTVKTTTWRNAWSGVRKTLDSVEQYIGAGRYHEPNRNRSKWDLLDDVLISTKLGNSIDFVMWKD